MAAAGGSPELPCWTASKASDTFRSVLPRILDIGQEQEKWIDRLIDTDADEIGCHFVTFNFQFEIAVGLAAYVKHQINSFLDHV